MADQYSTALSTHPYSNMFLVRKSKMSIYPSKSSPCVEMSFEKCRSIQVWKQIKEKYHCEIEFLQSRIYIKPTEAPCNSSVMIETLKMFNNPISNSDSFNCTKVVPCQYSRYLLRSTETDLPHFIEDYFTHHSSCARGVIRHFNPLIFTQNAKKF